MDEIKIIEQPDWISWDDIHNLLLEAHKKNIEKGYKSSFALMPGYKIKEKLGEEGRCWVALDGDKLVGTNAVYFYVGRYWWNKGKTVAHSCLTGILQKYQGIGILGKMDAMLVAYVRECGIEMIEGDTAESNQTMLKLVKSGGYKVVGVLAPKSPHYSVRFVKWFGECPFTDKYINRRCKISEKLTKWQYKPGRKERSKIVSLFCKIINKLTKIYYRD